MSKLTHKNPKMHRAFSYRDLWTRNLSKDIEKALPKLLVTEVQVSILL
nr:unnamed protein product [Callosobruchus analis]